MKLIIEVPDSVANTVRTNHDKAVMVNFFRNILKAQAEKFAKDSHQQISLIKLAEANMRVLP